MTPLDVARRSRRCRRLLAVLAGLLAAAVPGPAAAQPAQPPSPTVGTLAGPGFCPGLTRIDSAAPRVGAIAVDSDGWVFTDLPDAMGRGIVRAGDGTREVLLNTNEPAPPVPDPLASASAPPAASRLAGAGSGAVVVAAGPRVVEVVNSPPSLRSIAGIPSTQAPSGPSTSSGDGGPATDARFTSARSIATDGQRNLYIADAVDPANAVFRVRFLNRSDRPVTFYRGTPDELTVAPGRVDTIAGAAPGPGQPGDGVGARRAALQGVPPALAVTGDRLYIAAFWTTPGGGPPAGTVRLINLGSQAFDAHGVTVAAGTIQTVAGGGPGPDTDGGPARSTPLTYVPGVAADDGGRLYLAERDRNRVRLVDPAGTITTFAGSAENRPLVGVSRLDRPAPEISLSRPVDVKVGPGGRAYIADQDSGRLIFVDGSGTARLATATSPPPRCEQAAGSPPPSGGTDRAESGNPYSVVAGDGGAIYFVNLRTRQVMKRDAAGITSVVASASATCPTMGDCPATSPPGVRAPGAVAFANGGLYVYDVIGARVLFVNLGAKQATVNGVTVRPGDVGVLAGTGTPGAAGDGGPAVAAQLSGQGAVPAGNFPALLSIPVTENAVGDIAVAPDGTLFIGDGANYRVRQVDPAGIITTIAGTDGPPAASACCTMPSGLTTDGFGNLYVSDMGTRQIWFLNRGGVPVQAHGKSVGLGEAIPIAGNGQKSVGGDGVATDVPVYQPTGLATDGRGNLYVADYHDDTVRRIDTAGVIATVAGTGAGGFNSDGLAPRQTAFYAPSDVAFDPCGNLLVADLLNDRIRRIELVGPCQVAAPPGAAAGDGSSVLPLAAVAGGVALAVAVGVVAVRRRQRRPSSVRR